MPLVEGALGAAIGLTPQPIDGAQVTSPNVGLFTSTEQWEVENNGVAPDVGR